MLNLQYPCLFTRGYQFVSMQIIQATNSEIYSNTSRRFNKLLLNDYKLPISVKKACAVSTPTIADGFQVPTKSFGERGLGVETSSPR